jgi:hypothetical protein
MSPGGNDAAMELAVHVNSKLIYHYSLQPLLAMDLVGVLTEGFHHLS